ncbi:hypothetical protein OVO43_12350, partial [Streptococcus pneumoniae]|nr:hypothetical protein [Streptococcus pneumoniae]
AQSKIQRRFRIVFYLSHKGSLRREAMVILPWTFAASCSWAYPSPLGPVYFKKGEAILIGF